MHLVHSLRCTRRHCCVYAALILQNRPRVYSQQQPLQQMKERTHGATQCRWKPGPSRFQASPMTTLAHELLKVLQQYLKPI